MGHNQWWSQRLIISATIKEAEHMNEAYEGERLISLGQSPAWIVHTAGRLREIFGKASDTDYISFSGSFMRAGLPDYDQHVNFTINEDVRPIAVNMARYHSYLEEHEFTPADMCRHYEETGQRSIIAEAYFMGQGFASFLHAWLKSSQYDPDLLKKAVFFHLLRDNNVSSFSVEISGGQETFDQGHFTFRKTEDEALYTIGQYGEMDVMESSSRLVPSFDISRQGSGKLLHAHNHAVISTVKHNIEQVISDYYLPRWEKQAALGLGPAPSP